MNNCLHDSKIKAYASNSFHI